MAQFFQIEGTQQVFMVQGNNSIGLQFATQETCAVNQTNPTVLQHPQGVLLTDALVAPQNNSTIEVLGYANSQPPALYYHTTQQVVEPQQNEVNSQQSTIQIQQINQFQPLQGTLVGNQVVHNHITNETYEVTVEETDEQVEGAEVLYEGNITEEELNLQSEGTQTEISSTSEIEDKSGGTQSIQQSNQATSQASQSQPVYNQVVQQQIVQSVVSQPCVVQQVPLVQRTVPVQQQQHVSSEGIPVSATGNNLNKSYLIGTQASPQAVHSVLIQQPIQSENVIQRQQQSQVKQQTQFTHQVQQPQVFQQLKQQQILQHAKQQPQLLQQGKQQAQILHLTKQQSQVLQQANQQWQLLQQAKQQAQVTHLKQQPQVLQVKQQQVIQQVQQSPQVIHHSNQQPQFTQQANQQPQLIQQANQQPQLTQQASQQPQLMQQVNQQPQAIQQVNQQPQATQQANQQPQVIQQANQQSQVIQQVNQQSQTIQQASQQPQITQSVTQQVQVTPSTKLPQIVQSVSQQSPGTHAKLQSQSNLKQQQIEVSNDSTAIMQTLKHAGIKVTKTEVSVGRGRVQSNSLCKPEGMKKRRTPNITRRRMPLPKLNPIQLTEEKVQAPVQTPALVLPSTENIDLPPSKCDELIQQIKTEIPSDNSSQDQQIPSGPGRFWTLKGHVLTQYQPNSEAQAQSPHAILQESPQSLQSPVVHVRMEPSSASACLTPQLKQIVLQTSKRVHTYPSAKNRFVTKAVTTEPTSPCGPLQQSQQQQVQSQTLLIQRDPQVQQQSQVATPRKDQVVLVVPPRQLVQNNANLRVNPGNKLVQTFSLNDVQRAVIDGTISLKSDVSQGLVLASGGNVVVLKSDNAVMSSDGIKKLTFADGSLMTEKIKIVPGKLAVCKTCGQSSADFNRCTRCKRKLPTDCKVVETKDGINGILTPEKTKDALILEKLRTGRGGKILPIAVSSLEAKKKHHTPVRRAKIPDVPECLTLSSDDEDGSVNNESDALDAPCTDEEHKAMDDHDSSDEQHCTSGVQGGGLLEQAADGSLPGPLVQVPCRTVRIGSFKHKPLQRVIIAEPGIEVVVPNPDDVSDTEGIRVFISMQDIRRILLCSDRTMPVMFIHVKTTAGARIRELLKMSDPTSDFYFHPESKEEIYKRITFLPDKWSEENKVTLHMIFPKSLLTDIPITQANDILLRSCPREMQAQVRKSGPCGVSKIQTIMVYPPPPAKGGISINTEDYACLGEDVFLNDVIIDFYLKYLMLAVLSPEDQERTHVFSTFFYKRLTSPPGKSMRASHPIESNPNLSPAEKRHARVKSWTKNINIFTKDFIIIPINEKCHWFLAIICFPGQDGCVRMSDNMPISLTLLSSCAAAAASAAAAATAAAAAATAAAAAATAAAVAAASGSAKIKVNSNNVMSIGSTTITPVKATSDTITLDCSNGEEGSDRDEAEGDEDEMEEPTSEDEVETAATVQATEISTPIVETPAKTESPEKAPKVAEKPKNGRTKFTRDAIKQPCILIFDSLMGAPRSRVVATLRDYLRIEHKVKQGKEKDYNKDTIKGMMPKVPQQKNFTDCGLYLLQYVEQFFKDPIKDYHSPIKSLKDWFPAEIVRRKRQEIQMLLHKLMEDQKVDMSKLNLPTLTFSSLNKAEEEGAPEAPGECGEDEDGTAAPEAVDDAAQAVSDEAAAAHELVWGAAGAEEEVTTDGLPQHDEADPCEYGPMDGEEAFDEEEGFAQEEEIEDHEGMMYEDCEEEEEHEEMEGHDEFHEENEYEEAEEECGVTEGVVQKMPGPRLVNYPDSSEEAWDLNKSPASSSPPASVAVTTSEDSNKRTYVLSVRRSIDAAKRMRLSSDRTARDC